MRGLKALPVVDVSPKDDLEDDGDGGIYPGHAEHQPHAQEG